MEEIWKDIPGYEGIYQVSTVGNVKRLEKVCLRSRAPYILREKILKSYVDRMGYYGIHLRKNGKDKSFKVHQLVALTFIPNPENKPEVDHIDANRLNNVVDNLRWSTRKEQYEKNPITTLRIKLKNGSPIKDLISGKYYLTITDYAKAIGKPCTMVKHWIYRNRWPKGFLAEVL